MSKQIITYVNPKGKNIKYELPRGFDLNSIIPNEKIRKIFAIGLGVPVRFLSMESENTYKLIEELTPTEQLILIDEYVRITGLSVTAIAAIGSAFENGSGSLCFGYRYDLNEVGEGFVEYMTNSLTNSIFKNYFSIDVDDAGKDYRFIDIDVSTDNSEDDEYDKIEALFCFIEDLTCYCNFIYTIYSDKKEIEDEE